MKQRGVRGAWWIALLSAATSLCSCVTQRSKQGAQTTPHYARSREYVPYEPPTSASVDIHFVPDTTGAFAAEPAHLVRIGDGVVRMRVAVQSFTGTQPNETLIVFHARFKDSRGKSWRHVSMIPRLEFLPRGVPVTRQESSRIVRGSTWSTMVFSYQSLRDNEALARSIGDQFGLPNERPQQIVGAINLLPDGIDVDVSLLLSDSTERTRREAHFRYLLPYERFLFRNGPRVHDALVTPFASDRVLCYGHGEERLYVPRSPIGVFDERGRAADPRTTSAWNGVRIIRHTLFPPQPAPKPPPPTPRDVPPPSMPTVLQWSEPKRVKYRVEREVELPAANRVVRLKRGVHTGLLRLGRSAGGEPMFQDDLYVVAVFDFLDVSGRAWRHWGAVYGDGALFPYDGEVVTILPPEQLTDDAIDAAGPWDVRWRYYVDDRDDVVIPVVNDAPIKLRLKYTGFNAAARIESEKAFVLASLHAPEDPRSTGDFLPIEYSVRVDRFLWRFGPRRHDRDDWGLHEIVMLEPLVGDAAAPLRGTRRSPVRVEDVDEE